MFKINKDDLKWAFESCNGNKNELAKTLGITRATLDKYLKQFNLNEDNTYLELEALRNKVDDLKSALAIIIERNKELSLENSLLKQENEQLRTDIIVLKGYCYGK